LAINNEFLGAGWSFPPEFDHSNQAIKMVSGEQDIIQSLTLILSTPLGERVMAPDFGCAIKLMVFKEINQSTITEMKAMIRKAILFFETRIDLDNININIDNSINGELLIELSYTIISTNTRSNIVYPFYIMEGSLVNL
jgi:phage baseplate assembly protein W